MRVSKLIKFSHFKSPLLVGQSKSASCTSQAGLMCGKKLLKNGIKTPLISRLNTRILGKSELVNNYDVASLYFHNF